MQNLGLIDTHAHLYSDKFEEDRSEMMQRAFDAGLSHIFLPNIDSSSIGPMLALEAAYPQQCFAMMGLHPCSVGKNMEEELALVKNWLEKRPFVAVGEIGLDYYWSMEFVEEQKEAFRRQSRWAMQLNLPIVIHARDSIDDLIKLVEELQEEGPLRGVFHCFTGTLEQAQKIIELGFYLGFGGVLTFKKAGLDQLIPHLPLSKIVIETDAPYLSPTPKRGKRNESAYLLYVAQKMADIKGISLEELAQTLKANSLALFDLSVLEEGIALKLDI